MEKIIDIGKWIIAIIGSLILSSLGGMDDLLCLLVALAFVDVILGALKGIKQKQFSSAILLWGLINKAFIFCVVAIMVRIDMVLGVNIFRNAFIIWFSICDGASLLENSAVLGVPWPDGMQNILVQVRKGFSINISKIVKKMIEEYLPDEKEE